MFIRRPRSTVNAKLKAQGFTLLEILIVMVIIGLLAGLVGPKVLGKADSSKVQTAKTQLKMLKSAIGIMQLDLGVLPTAEQGLKLLEEAPTQQPLRNQWKGPYIEGRLPLDPWNNPYVYVVPGENGQPFTLKSWGADGKQGGEGLNADLNSD
ncbi:type II secretion system major pseudopilin GspG [Mitsuaria sp. WAJ17]|uniref:type II secretion system major pseudopilin GspG n=1 Tax=Mitsuaria sp. WAJ17 TaxID=2761452 RepID=UPI00160096D8|nr:type II secretion system major pseudopilin GspG [Mitsuaria sp. WAJ17]MBB2484224.1 type II secretion system major pseudopilin GspG [Mitsuaria sp. WAJ17]